MHNFKELIRSLFGKFNFALYKVSSIDTGLEPGEYVLNFINRITKRHFQMSIDRVFGNKNLLNKFDSEDAVLIGHYYAKLSYEKSRY